MSPDDSFHELMARLKAGDDDAATQLFNRFACRLIALARSRLDPRIRQKVDPEDVVLSAFGSFFRRQANDEFDLGGWDSLWGLLSAITLHKCGRQVEHFRAAKRAIRRELSSAEAEAVRAAVAREPTAAEVAVFHETLEQVMRTVEPRERQVLQLRLQGYTVPEISAEVQFTEFTVEAVLKRIKRRLKRLRDEASAGP